VAHALAAQLLFTRESQRLQTSCPWRSRRLARDIALAVVHAPAFAIGVQTGRFVAANSRRPRPPAPE
jgi:hypothetical protein